MGKVSELHAKKKVEDVLVKAPEEEEQLVESTEEVKNGNKDG